MQAHPLDVHGQRIAVYSSASSGPTVLLIHGNSCSARAFERQFNSPLATKYHLVALDLPGHGASENAHDPAHTNTLPGYAAVMVDVVRQMGLSQLLLVGWSLGGHIALEADHLLPEVVGHLIYGTPPIGFPPALGEAFFPHPAMGVAFAEHPSDDELAGFVQACFRPEADDIPEVAYSDAKRTDGRARASLAASIAPDGYRDEITIVANLAKPLAVLHGEHEQLVNSNYFATLTMPTLWQGAVQIIPGAGHAPHWEQAERFNALIDAFAQDSLR